MLGEAKRISLHRHVKNNPSLPEQPAVGLKKYQSCRSTLNKYQQNVLNLGIGHPSNISPSKSPLKRQKSLKSVSGKSITDELQLNLNYSQKLNSMEKILKKCKEFSSIYGYFSITQPMISFNTSSKEIDCWIHPDRRAAKPLHPIKGSTDFDRKKIFYLELKNLLKKMFPTIPQPSGSTYLDLILNIKSLKRNIQKKVDKSQSLPVLNPETHFFRKENIVKPPTLVNEMDQTIFENEQENLDMSSKELNMDLGGKEEKTDELTFVNSKEEEKIETEFENLFNYHEVPKQVMLSQVSAEISSILFR